jgi:hypothetical protein
MFRKLLLNTALFFANRRIKRIYKGTGCDNITAIVSQNEKKTILLVTKKSTPREVFENIPDKILSYHIKVKWVD